MTIPAERTRAVLMTAKEIKELSTYLIDKKFNTVSVPRSLLSNLVHWQKHYPTAFDLEMSAEKAPSIWSKPDEY